MQTLDPNKTASVAIIIVNWNTGKLLAACLRSLQQLPEQELISQIIIVDNDSHDDSIADAEAVAVQKKIIFVQAEKNFGFAAANNLGIKQVVNPLADIFLLNPDTEVERGAILKMVADLKHNPRIGIVGAHLRHPNHTTQPSIRQFPTLAVFVIQFLKLHHLLPELRVWQQYMMQNFNYDQVAHVDQVMGAAMLIRRKAWDQLQGLDEDFFIWFEEVDFCRRAKNRGWLVQYEPEASIIHHGGVSFDQVVGWHKSALWLRSCLTYARKYLPLGLLLLLPLSAIAFFVAIVTTPFIQAKVINK